MLDAHADIVCGPELGTFAHPWFWKYSGQQWRDKFVGCMKHNGDQFNVDNPSWMGQADTCQYLPIYFDSTLLWHGDTTNSYLELSAQCDSGIEFADKLFKPLLDKKGAKMWAEKTPQNVHHIKDYLDNTPDSYKAIIMVRDALDTVASLKRKRWSTLRNATAQWLLAANMARELRDHPRVHIMRYEDLTRRPEKEIGKMLKFLGVRKTVKRLLEYPKHSRDDRSAAVNGHPRWLLRPTDGFSTKSIGCGARELQTAELYALSRYKLVSTKAGVNELQRAFGYTTLPQFNNNSITLSLAMREEQRLLDERENVPLMWPARQVTA
jgi:hypothetical protein